MSQPATSPWDRLALPPRDVPPEVRFRVRAGEFFRLMNLNSSMASAGIIFFLFFGLIATILGAAIIAAGPSLTDTDVEKNLPQLFAILGPISFLGGLVWLVSAVAARSNRKLHLLRFGRVAPATCTKVWDRQVNSWVPYAEAAEKWRGFSSTVQQNYGAMMEKIAEQAQQWPCKIRVADSEGKEHEITMRMALDYAVSHPDLLVLCDPPKVNDAILLSEFYRTILVSPTGHWEVESSNRTPNLVRAFLRSAIPVIGTYIAAALGISLFGEALSPEKLQRISVPHGAGYAMLFTLTHAIIPVYIVRLMLDVPAEMQSMISAVRRHWLINAFFGVFYAFTSTITFLWFALPIVGLAYLTGWLSIAWAAVHVAIAGRGRRVWTFIEYGSTSMALLLFILNFTAEKLVPQGLIVVILQALLLTILDLTARKRWVSTNFALLGATGSASAVHES
jgi:hypothetical protein